MTGRDALSTHAQMPPARPLIVAHRGLHHSHPENSHAAFRAAWQAGIEWCECDVHLDRFDRPYILHDDSLDRTTTATGPIAAHDWRQLADVHLRGADGLPTNERLPPLDAVVGYMTPRQALLVEMKVPMTWKNDTGVFWLMFQRRARWMLQSFDRAFIESVPASIRFGNEYLVPTALLVDAATFSPEAAAADVTAVHVEHTALTAATVALLRGAGKGVGAWTVNTEADLRRVIGLGVDMVITDEPFLARALTDKLCAPVTP